MISPYSFAGCKELPAPLTIEAVFLKGADKFNVRLEDLLRKTRKKHIVYARQIITTVAYDLKAGTLAEIGAYIGQDHSTIIHARQTVEAHVKLYPQVKQDYEAFRETIIINYRTKAA